MSAKVNHIVICGYDPGTRMLLDVMGERTASSDQEIVIFAPHERPKDIPPGYSWIDGDPTKETELGKARLAFASTAVIVGRRDITPQMADAQTILTAFTIRSYVAHQSKTSRRSKPLYIVAEILDAENVVHAHTAGADEVIETTLLGFSLLAHAVEMPGTADIMGKVAVSGNQSLYLGKNPAGDTTFGELSRRVKSTFGAIVLGFRHPDTHIDTLNPPDSAPVPGHMYLIYLAPSCVLPEP
jgi:Trk K+ transport system NAD-binding subunit